MFDTPVTVVGNVLTAPEWRRTASTGTSLVTFRVAATSRRFDRESGQWVDGDSLRARVTCWRRLGDNVEQSVQVGDPVVVAGRLYSRDWTDDQGVRRTSLELDASAVGHDLARGTGIFTRRKAGGPADLTHDGAGAIASAVERPDDGPLDQEVIDKFVAEVFEPADDAEDDAEDDGEDDAPDESPSADPQAPKLSVAPPKKAAAKQPELAGAGRGTGGKPRGSGRPRAAGGAGSEA
jgi:single-strand DNA-binding protein